MFSKSKRLHNYYYPFFFVGVVIVLAACSSTPGTEKIPETPAMMSTEPASGIGMIIVESAPLRSNPDEKTDYSRLLYRDTMVTLLAQTSDARWYLVQTPEMEEGWVLAEFIEMAIATAAITVSSPAGYPMPSEIPITPFGYPVPSEMPINPTVTPTVTPTVNPTIPDPNIPTDTPCVGYDCFFPPPHDFGPFVTNLSDKLGVFGWLGAGLFIGWLIMFKGRSDQSPKKRKR